MPATKIDANQVRQIANLARLKLSEQEIQSFSLQLSDILGYIEKLNKIDTSGVEPLAHCLPVSNVFRTDEIKPSLGTEKTLANAPQCDEKFFLVPKILEES